jgi:hypothetical protein
MDYIHFFILEVLVEKGLSGLEQERMKVGLGMDLQDMN